jgi:integrase/recombinase XerD
MVHKIAPEDPDDLAAEALRFLEWMRIRGYSKGTIYAREGRLGDLVTWCAERGVTRPAELSQTVLELYQRHIATKRRSNGAAISLLTQSFILTSVRSFCSWLAKRRLIAYNPAAELELPKTPTRIPRTVLSPEEAEEVLAVPDVTTPIGLRDRAILETFYSTGIRRGELAKLEISDLDLDRQALLIREGKARKDRVVPTGERALAWIRAYLAGSRPHLVMPPDDGVLFLNRFGQAFGPNSLSRLVSKLVKASGIAKQGSAHMLRHTMATAMLDGGADIRSIQQMLGHSSLATTQVYTHVSIQRLKEVHAASHPGARLKRARGPGEEVVGSRLSVVGSKSQEPATNNRAGRGEGLAILLDDDDERDDQGRDELDDGYGVN